MASFNIIILLVILCVILVDCYLIENKGTKETKEQDLLTSESKINEINDVDYGILEEKAANVFDGVYSECFLYLSYTCIQRKTLLYLYELNNLSEVSVLGDYIKFVKTNITNSKEDKNEVLLDLNTNSHNMTVMIDKAVDKFFNGHVLRVSALGKDILVPRTVEEFVGRKRRKGGGGGGGGHGGGGHDDGGKKKMMMMAMMCMKMKLMMMVPAMMGMMGMMSFKGMMFSMMSFMISKMMLLMKILEKKGGGGGSGGGGGDGGWAAGGGGGGGAWMPAGGQEGYGGAGGGGGYDANGQWQSRSIPELTAQEEIHFEKPLISSIVPVVRYNNVDNNKKPLAILRKLNDDIDKGNNEAINVNKDKGKGKSRKKRGIMDVLQNAYVYWTSKLLGYTANKPNSLGNQKFKIVNGVKYIYYPMRYINKPKAPKAIQPDNNVNNINDEEKVIITAEDFNKGEIVEGGVESRTHKKKLKKMTQTINDVLEDSPWQ